MARPRSTGARLTITDAATGVVTYNWGTADTNTAGDYEAEVEVMWNDGKPETFPNDSYWEVTISRRHRMRPGRLADDHPTERAARRRLARVATPTAKPKRRRWGTTKQEGWKRA